MTMYKCKYFVRNVLVLHAAWAKKRCRCRPRNYFEHGWFYTNFAKNICLGIMNDDNIDFLITKAYLFNLCCICILTGTIGIYFTYKYSSVLNNRAANLILFWKKSILHALIPSCTFINFWIFLAKKVFYTNEKWKSPSYMALFHPTRLSIFGYF